MANAFAPVRVIVRQALADKACHQGEAAARAETDLATNSMSPGRRAEYMTARRCARSALAEIGAATIIARDDRGAPIWPDGITGSISHTQRWCVAVVAQTNDVSAIGVDAETIERLQPHIAQRILTDTELSIWHKLGFAEQRLVLAASFAAKEAFYKAHYQIDNRYLGFGAIALEPLPMTRQGRCFVLATGNDVSEGLCARTILRVVTDGTRAIAGAVIERPL